MTCPITANRYPQWLLLGSFLPLCWFGMLAVHELGHVLAAWLSGGTVSKVVLYPLTVSRTDLSHNPQPLLVAWSGPVAGAALPALALTAAGVVGLRAQQMARFFAGFCLIGNGAYLGIGSFAAVGDAGDIMRCGSPSWLLWLFALVTIPVGFVIWHRLGPRFGLGAAGERVGPVAAAVCCLLLVTVLVLAFALSPR